MASPLVTAMLKGAVCILDEGNRMSEKSWASLAPLLDDRRYVESLLTGLQLKAHPDFRLAVTMNEDASTFEIPEYIHTRLMPQIHVDFPEEDEERAILQENLPFAPEALLEAAFGRYAGGGKTHTVRLLFEKNVAEWITEREWHPQQTLKRRRNGDVELAFPAKGLFEVRRWVLS